MTVVSGILEAMKGSPEGRIRQFSDGLVADERDAFVLPEFMAENGVAPGAAVTVEVEERKSRRSRARRMVASKLVSIEGLTPEEFRKRKDKYKQLYLESNAQAQARSTIIDSMRDDRQTFVTDPFGNAIEIHQVGTAGA